MTSLTLSKLEEKEKKLKYRSAFHSITDEFLIKFQLYILVTHEIRISFNKKRVKYHKNLLFESSLLKSNKQNSKIRYSLSDSQA